MSKYIIRTPEDCDMVANDWIGATALKLGLEQNHGHPIWYEPNPGGKITWGKLPAQDPVKRVTSEIISAGRSHGRLPTIICPYCHQGRHVAGGVCTNCLRRA